MQLPCRQPPPRPAARGASTPRRAAASQREDSRQVGQEVGPRLTRCGWAIQCRSNGQPNRRS
eukprot:15482068-Alexandrium_andersonii.AAC.1